MEGVTYADAYYLIGGVLSYSIHTVECGSILLDGRIERERGQAMKKYKVYATTTTQLVTEIEADSYEEAVKYAENELITGDFEAINTDFHLDLVTESEGK